MPDITYRKDGLFIRFYADTKVGEAAWSALAAQSEGTAAFLSHQGPSIVRQLRAAGYSVARASDVTMSTDDLLAALSD